MSYDTYVLFWILIFQFIQEYIKETSIFLDSNIETSQNILYVILKNSCSLRLFDV